MKQLVLLAFLFAAVPGQSPVDRFVARTYRNKAGQTMPYRLFIPDGYDKAKKYPLVMWLHGAGGAGNDNLLQIQQDQLLGTHIWTRPENQAKHPAFVLVPQSPGVWADLQSAELSPPLAMAVGILDSVEAEFSIDVRRVYVAGQSNGGVGTWDLVSKRPDRFAAAVPLCGAGNPALARGIANLPIWAFHGAQDTVIPVQNSRQMIAAVTRAGGHPRYSEYPKVGHEVWIPAFNEPELVEWLFAQHR